MSYSLFQTADNSFTLKNHLVDENYHSNAGAWQEAQLKYFDACNIKKYSEVSDVHIFEVGFGLGYNLLPILDKIENLKHKIYFVTSEYDTSLFTELIKQAETLYPEKYLNFFLTLLTEKYYDSDILNVQVLQGDVRKSIQTLENDRFHAIFHDAFSPYKNTECWTQEFFEQEFRILNKNGILSTYSISTPVRSGMFQAGFEIWEGVGDQTKSSGTIATKRSLKGLSQLNEKSYQKLFDSPERIPFRDNDLSLDRNVIKKNRLNKKEAQDYSDCKRFS